MQEREGKRERDRAWIGREREMRHRVWHRAQT